MIIFGDNRSIGRVVRRMIFILIGHLVKDVTSC